ncbi:MAG TPA: hypothetical protein PLT26_15955 [Anaerolineaceae bacterium]|nr:hypothetical protein [Anaerolineaceae bacterium]HQH87034.1 hypothetical protein [Anaerolineaceae bacterium]
MTWQNLLSPFAWLLNGLLVVLYSLLLHWQAALLAPALAWLGLRGPVEHRTWAVGIAIAAMLTAVLAAQPVPLLLLVIAAAGCGALALERINPTSLHWRIIAGVALYTLIGVGVTAFQWYLESLAGENLLIAQGQAYIGILAVVGLYGFPLGFLAMLAQGMLVHPPLPGKGSPEELIHQLRAKKQD